MAKVTKKVCTFLGTDIVLVNDTPNKKQSELENELNVLARMLQLVIMDGIDSIDPIWYDLGGKEIEDGYSGSNGND